jgi:hypothetical protein
VSASDVFAFLSRILCCPPPLAVAQPAVDHLPFSRTCSSFPVPLPPPSQLSRHSLRTTNCPSVVPPFIYLLFLSFLSPSFFSHAYLPSSRSLPFSLPSPNLILKLGSTFHRGGQPAHHNHHTNHSFPYVVWCCVICGATIATAQPSAHQHHSSHPAAVRTVC